MYKFRRWPEKWWQKPLVDFEGHPLPAELAILELELTPEEDGVWLNSRGVVSGVRELKHDPSTTDKKYGTKRMSLPEFVANRLIRIYQKSGLKKGCPDLVVWNLEREKMRLIEVKCPHWDRPSPEQHEFMKCAKSLGVTSSIVEWEFE